MAHRRGARQELRSASGWQCPLTLFAALENSASSLSDVVLGRHRLAVAQEHPYPSLHLLVGLRGPGALVQVVGPGGDDKSLDRARRIAEVALDAP